MKLEFGCGSKLTKGYVGCDIRKKPGVQYVCNAWEIVNQVQPNSVEEVYSRHFLEHLTAAQADKTLSAWFTILQTDGKIVTEVPDLVYHCKQFLDVENHHKGSDLNPKRTNIDHAMAGFYGWQRGSDMDTWDLHKCGYSFDLLTALLTKHGFREVKRLPSHDWNLAVEARK